MLAKDFNKLIDITIKKKTKTYITYEELIQLFDKQPTITQSKNILKVAKKYRVNLITSSEQAEILSKKDIERRRRALKKILEEVQGEEFNVV